TDFRVIGLVSLAHGISHFFQLVVPPPFPMLVSEFDVSYAALGAMMTLFYAISGIAQTAAGFLVDRIGARRVLLGGLGVFAGAIAAVGLAPSFWLLFPLAIIAGIGNSVFHPADFAILNDRVGHKHLGRAYGVHAIAGNIGWALAPVASVGLAAVIGWRFALVALGCVGLAMVAMLAVSDALLDRGQPAKRAGAEVVGTAESLRLLMVTPILMCFAYFVLLAISMVGLQTFAIPTTMQF